MEYSYDGPTSGLEREPGSVDEEDIHGFLSNRSDVGERRS
jgi:hypothetical protein